MKETELRKRLFLSFFLIIVVPLPVFFLIGIKGIIPYMEKVELYRLMRDTIDIAADIQEKLKEFKSDVLILSELDILKELIREKNRIDSPRRERLEAFFVSFARHKPIYYQVRYIDEKGREVVRVNDGVAVPKAKLQDKSHRYYYLEAIKLRKGQLYVSPLDLNREWGRIEIPFRPVIRYATPVILEGVPKGIVITNVDARRFLEEIQKNAIDSTVKPMLIDSDGYYLSHPDKSKEWGGPNDLNTGENIKKDFSTEIIKRIMSGRTDVFVDNENHRVFAFAPIYPGTKGKRPWFLVQQTTFDYGGFKTVHYLKRLIIIITIVSFITGTYLSYLLSGWLARTTCEK